jgi:integrase
MATLRPRKDTGQLFFDFRWQGRRYRAPTDLPDTAESRKVLAPKLKQLNDAISRGVFALDAFFPELVEQRVLVTSPFAATPIAASMVTPLFSTFAEQWFGEFKVGWRRTYITTVRGTLDRHLIPRFGPVAIGAITRAQILDLRAHLSASRGRREGSKLSPARINTIMLILRQILQEAADRYEFTMPMGRLKPLKIPKSDVDPFTLEQAQLIIDSVRRDYRNYMVTRFFTGMRSGELHGLKWKYVDFERRLILVRETIVGGQEEYTKTDSSQREIVMSQLVFDALKAQHKATGHLDYVFCNRAGEPLDTNNFTKRVWYPLLRHLGLALRRPYQTRHTAATLWLAAGESPEWIARQLGHASTEMLFRVYSRYVPNLTRRDGSAIDRLLATRFATADDVGEAANANTVPSEGRPSASGALKAQPPPAPLTRAA